MKDKEVRRGAAEALGKLGDTRAVEPLIEALGDGSEYVRNSAAGALGKLGDTRAVEPLIEALEDEYGKIRRAAAEALIKYAKNQPNLIIHKWDRLAEVIQRHYDGSYKPYSSDCSVHTDKGIGLKFPDKPKNLDF